MCLRSALKKLLGKVGRFKTSVYLSSALSRKFAPGYDFKSKKQLQDGTKVRSNSST